MYFSNGWLERGLLLGQSKEKYFKFLLQNKLRQKESGERKVRVKWILSIEELGEEGVK